MGFTHVEFMPVMEHPFDGSWGYQCTGFFAATSRFGDPQGLMRLIDACHQDGIGVILDWVPSHFPYDAHGLFMFDGTHTYEYADMRKGFHPDWNSYIFNYKRGEVKSFLISSARYWFDKFSFSMMYYYDENFMLPFSHDEVVHGKSPMLYKMPGDEWRKFANLRLMYTYMWTHPGAKLLFMGDEFGQNTEWNYKSELDWHLLQYDSHHKLKDCVADLNKLLQNEPAMYENQFNIYGFEWVDLNHRAETVVSYRRKGKNSEDDLLIILNLTPVVRNDWEVYVSSKQFTKEIFNSDDKKYWG